MIFMEGVAGQMYHSSIRVCNRKDLLQACPTPLKEMYLLNGRHAFYVKMGTHSLPFSKDFDLIVIVIVELWEPFGPPGRAPLL